MTEVVIKNKELLETLNGFKDMFFAIPDYDDPQYRMHSSPKALEDPEYFCGEDYLQFQKSLGLKHSGFPEEHMSMPVNNAYKHDPEKFTEYRERVKFQFAAELGAHTSALLNYYPPRGFVGWHTNWNANAYQVLFTYSKDGNGYFRYWDNEKREVVHIQDKVGWQCRHYYFGKHDEPDHHCWHAAYAGGERITLAYKFVNKTIHAPENQMAMDMRDRMIEEIEYDG
tara:strand:+ start:678 stop:1355 length:678 start_codon:yes stop_codon:yes gene_type:complete